MASSGALCALAMLLALVGRRVASAQLAADQIPRERTIPVEDAIKQELESARYRLGPIRILPRLAVSNAGYDSNVFGTPENCKQIVGCNETKKADWGATVSAGARLVAPAGAKLFVTGDLLPQYTWYRELKSRRTLGGFFSTSLYAFFNRMSIVAGGYSSKTFGPLSSETDTRIVEVALDGSASIEVDVSRNISAFAGAEIRRARLGLNGETPAVSVDVKQLDRDDQVARAGIRYRISPQWDVTLGAEGTRALFVEAPETRNNQTLAYLLGIHYSRPRFFAAVSGGRREGRAYQGSIFPNYSTTTYSYFASYFVIRKLELQGFGHRGVLFGSPLPENLVFNNLFFVETRYGGGINLEVHPRLLLRVQAEYGTNDFPAPVLIGTTLTKRKDKVSIVAGGFSALVYKKIVLTGLASRQKYDSPVPSLSRTVDRFTTSLSFEGQLSR
ncbi:MAG: hypothetical protein M3R62_03545 [Acidobacteriota bacterium]|nr:hypothetical protein [Acidobacteriota bacterium]